MAKSPWEPLTAALRQETGAGEAAGVGAFRGPAELGALLIEPGWLHSLSGGSEDDMLCAFLPSRHVRFMTDGSGSDASCGTATNTVSVESPNSSCSTCEFCPLLF